MIEENKHGKATVNADAIKYCQMHFIANSCWCNIQLLVLAQIKWFGICECVCAELQNYAINYRFLL